MKAGRPGSVIIHATREWLAFHAHSGDELTREDLLRAVGKTEDDNDK